jgi:ribosomal protein S12 methylthiotransferase accessory factor
MRLRESVTKAPGTNREFDVAETLRRITPYLRELRVTRLADVTGLDFIGIPVYSAIAPRAHDVISVYNGKGATPEAAKVSAIMEAAERFAATLPMRPAAVGSYRRLSAAGAEVLDPRALLQEIAPHYRDDEPISWVTGHDLLRDVEVLVPYRVAGYHMSAHEPAPHTTTSTNGLASGNSLEEAICHALSEVIERDAETLADIGGRRVVAAARAGALRGVSVDATAVWVGRRYPRISPAGLPGAAGDLVGRVRAAGARLDMWRITSDIAVPTVLAVVSQDLGEGFSHRYGGAGTHPDAHTALTRAVTEAVQSRSGDMQAVREDVSAVDAAVPGWALHTQRRARRDPTAAPAGTATSVPLADLASYPSADLMDDVRLQLEMLAAAGLDRAVVVDLSPPGIPVHVVRVIVPGLESWIVDRAALGTRALRTWNTAMAELRGADPPHAGPGADRAA